MVSQERLVNRFLDLVRIYGPSKNERQVADYVKEVLSSLGLTVEEDNTGEKIGGNCGNLFCKMPAQIANRNCKREKPSFVLLAHLDTVEPSLGVEPVLQNGLIFSKGDTILCADNRAGVAVLLELATVLLTENVPHGELELLFTVAEEVGLLGAKNFDFSKSSANYGIVLDGDGPVGTITVKSPSAKTFTAVCIGKSAHAGVCPEKGVSAIQIASLAISKMRLGRIDPETTANIGVISGGIARNVVPEKVEIKGEARSHNIASLEKQLEEMSRALEESAAYFGGKVKIDVVPEFNCFNISPDHYLVQLLQETAKAIGLTSQTISSGGGSDANVCNENGIPTVNVSVGGENAHTKEERIAIEDLTKATEWILKTVCTC